MKILYTAHATASGEGRDGVVRTPGGQLELALASPVELGGPGGATNPEELFAAGYAACFHSALRLVARSAKADVDGSEVSASVGLGKAETGYGIAVTLKIAVPRVSTENAKALVAKAHQVCPYSNATRGNVDVALEIVGA
jgi:Ohr subfamily peroxiredoxin